MVFGCILTKEWDLLSLPQAIVDVPLATTAPATLATTETELKETTTEQRQADITPKFKTVRYVIIACPPCL